MTRLSILLLLICPLGAAAEHRSAHAAPANHARPAPLVDDNQGPVLSTDDAWARAALGWIGGLFIAAAFVGPIYRAAFPAPVEPAPTAH